jgi:cytidylate kinase
LTASNGRHNVARVEPRVVCISGSTGALAETVAPIVAGRLGFRLIDEGIIARAAREAGLEPHVLADVERRKSFVARLFKDLGTSAGSVAAGSGFPISDAGGTLTSDDLRALIRAAIEETAAQGDVVIVSHAASLALARREDVLRVLITGSRAARSARVAESGGLSEKEAERKIDEEDAARADYLRRFYDVEVELPTHYDIVVSTDRLRPEDAAELVLLAAAPRS